MNRLSRPSFFNDHAAIVALSHDPALKSYPNLLPHVAAIRAGYNQYIAAKGDVTAITSVPLPIDVEKLLKAHYASPSADIAHIDQIRSQSGVKTCPMCGSMYSGTLDHVLPKTSFASFAIFGPNLVPACQCNTLRSTTLIGPNPGERILHPYFDDILRERLLAAQFEDLGRVPRVSVQLLLKPTHPSHAGAQFHLQNVVGRTQVADWVRNLWSKLVLKPGNVIRDLRQNPDSREQLVQILEQELETLDDLHESKNNWHSIFLAGLLRDDAVDWLYDRLSDPGRLANSELVTV